MAYHLDYVSKPDRFDEVVVQDGVKVVIDSKALFSIIGSVMDWEEGRISSRFVFNSLFRFFFAGLSSDLFCRPQRRF